jgi:hypothetical protein
MVNHVITLIRQQSFPPLKWVFCKANMETPNIQPTPDNFYLVKMLHVYTLDYKRPFHQCFGVTDPLRLFCWIFGNTNRKSFYLRMESKISSWVESRGINSCKSWHQIIKGPATMLALPGLGTLMKISKFWPQKWNIFDPKICESRNFDPINETFLTPKFFATFFMAENDQIWAKKGKNLDKNCKKLI